jgi:hypothetical protein
MSPEMHREFIEPVSPEGLDQLKRELIPPEVFETFNRLLGEKAVNGYAVINQDEVVKELTERGLERQNIFRKGWLNIESLYEANGWKVIYERPGYNESGQSYFTFRAKKD